MTELKNGTTFDIPIGKREAETPAEIFREDIKIKKSCVPHYSPKSNSTFPSKKRILDMNGDTYKISLGYPMTFVEYRQLPSDDLKRMYIESMSEKYPGFSHYSLAKMMGISGSTAARETKRLGIDLSNSVDKKTIEEHNREIAGIIEKINNGEMPRNLIITKNKKVGKIRRKNFDEINNMELEEAKAYVLSIYNQYDCALGRSEFGELFGCSEASVSKLFATLGIRLHSGPVKSPSILATRERFRNEMLSMPVTKRKSGTHKANNKVASQKKVSASTSEFDINAIECVIDSENIAKFLKTYGFSGRIKIRVEKV